MMDKQKALKEARRSYRQTIVSIVASERIAKKVIPHLPSGWKIDFRFNGGLDIRKYEKANAIEFRVICDVVEKVIGKKVVRDAVGENTLRGEASYFETLNRWISIDIYMGNVEGCKIEKKRKMTTVYEASPECLGLKGES